jgi:hypothetical protein
MAGAAAYFGLNWSPKKALIAMTEKWIVKKLFHRNKPVIASKHAHHAEYRC